jgi:hypothetical protein
MQVKERVMYWYASTVQIEVCYVLVNAIVNKHEDTCTSSIGYRHACTLVLFLFLCISMSGSSESVKEILQRITAADYNWSLCS